MTAIIIDDTVEAAQDLCQKLSAYPDIQVVGVAHNSFDGLALASERHPDVLFLDVEMPGISGLDFLDRVDWVRDGSCRVVMYTAFSDFILPSMRKQAFDVLLKPIDPNELQTIVKRLREQPPQAAPAGPRGEKVANTLLLYTNTTDFHLVKKSDVGIFQYDSGNRCWEALIASCDKPLRMKRSIKAATIVQLDSKFVQVNQKYIVNMTYLVEVADGHCRFFPPFDKVDYVTVGRFYRRRLTDRFFSL